MYANNVRFLWRDPHPARGFEAAVSLHGHTMHSEECLSFLPGYLHLAPGISQIAGYYERRRGVDFGRAWWTPPLSPASAVALERAQIARLGLRPMVSLTDHDNIEAGLSLGIAGDPAEIPLSVEWTVPYGKSFFHLGIHHIPRRASRAWMDAMAEYTANPREGALPAILETFGGQREALVVLNHPFWLEEGVVESEHRLELQRILRRCGERFHAFELNGTRPWRENAETIELAQSQGRPVIAGGDRHACEPSACLNLTNARSFAEFVAEIRAGHSSILFLPQYREPMAQRVLEAARDILRFYPEYPGRERWSDRIFYRGEDGKARSVSEICHGSAPRLVSGTASAIQFFAGARFRPALRMVFSARGEMHP